MGGGPQGIIDAELTAGNGAGDGGQVAPAAPATPPFHRPPRLWPDPVPTGELRIVAPPTKPEPPSGGLMQMLFPVVGSFSLLAFALVYRNRTFLYVAVGLVVLSLLFAAGMRYSQRRQVKVRRKENRKKYTSYLRATERRLAELADRQLTVADRLYPDHERLWGLVLRRQQIWERRLRDEDFLRVRLGRGRVPHVRQPRLDLGDDPLADRERDLEDEAKTISGRWKGVNDLPVVVDLSEAQVVSVVGDPSRARALARAIIAQLAAFRAPGDVRVMAVYDSAAGDEWEWLKWLPHGRAEVRARQDAPDLLPPPILLAASPQRLGDLLEGELGPRLEQLRRIEEQGPLTQETGVTAPRLVIFVDGFSPHSSAARLPQLREALDRGRLLNVTTICLTDAPEREPSEADLRVVLSANGSATVEERWPEVRRWEGVWPDAGDVGLCEGIARELAPLRLADSDSEPNLADGKRLIELLGHPDVAGIDPAETWRPRPRRDELRVPVGVDRDGEPVVLDLKQPAEGGMGPHGLIVGATGSGKSELLRTLVASLAIGHSPETLAFVLVDYKGGAAFAELARLPHTAGLITNLQEDQSLVDRMRDALLGEQERRQQLLRDAGNVDDVHAYRAAREADPTLPPLPHLLVIVDEFGELLANRPEFIDLFLGIGRVGRSLGMHLLFSSQRLEEGRLRGLDSHLRYRICLRTNSAADSKSVLGTADAYLLPPFPGAAYLKVDTGLYERLKVALVSTPHEDRTAVVPAAAAVEVFTPGADGQQEVEVEVEDRPAEGGARTELDVVVSRLVAARGERRVHQVWDPPLGREIRLAELEAIEPWWERPAGEREPTLRVPVGLVDLPLEQRKEPLMLDFTGTAGHLAIVGAPQSGKSILLRTLMSALVRAYTPDEVQLYCIDLGGGSLATFEAAPHVGGVCGKLEREKVRQVVRLVRAIIDDRETAFRRLAVDSIADVRARRARGELDGEDLPDVFLAIDNWGMLGREFEDLDREAEQIATAGLNFGVHLVITANRWVAPEMRPSLRDSIGNRLELRLNDPVESEINRAQAKTLPDDVPGRGLTRAGNLFQAALPDMSTVLEAEERWSGATAPPVPVLPLRVEAAHLPGPDEDSAAGVPIGLDEFRLDPVYVNPTGGDPHFLVLGDAETGKTTFLRHFARSLMARETPDRAQIMIVDYRRRLLDVAEGPHLLAYAANAAMTGEAAAEVKQVLEARLPAADATREELLRGPSWSGPRVYVLIDDYDLVESTSGNPLLPLVDLLPHGRDVGLHLVLARRVGGVGRKASFEPLFQRLNELGTPGLVMSGDPQEGYVLGNQRASSLPPGRGYLVSRSRRTSLVQTAFVEPSEVA